GLDAGKLRIPSVTAPIVIADGRAQLVKLSAPAQNADISGSISLALADWQLEARLAMTGPPRKNAPTAERPAMAVAVRGPLTAARRVVDVAHLVGWAPMRAVDQEAKRLDAAEKERQRLEPAVEGLRHSPDATVAAPSQTGTLPPAPTPQTSTAGRPPELVVPPGRRAPPPPPSTQKPFNLMESPPAGGPRSLST